ncbi:MAG: hypothetical protein JWN67_4212 [Actinomycetia bacterium]|nr:hypothetical protein [Actinomycetes bacterium]
MSLRTRLTTSARLATGVSLGLALTLVGLTGTASATGDKATGDKKAAPASADKHDASTPTTSAAPAKKKAAATSPTTAAKKEKAKGAGTTGGQAPAGNNGHIKIDDFVMQGGNRNRPHQTCGLSVSFFGYDTGTQSASITLTPWKPTAGGTPLTLQTSWHVDSRTSGNQFDKNVPISGAQVAEAFQGVTPKKQGFHARIDVHVTGSQGADGKHKMVWIKPCASSSTGSDGKVSATGSSSSGAASSESELEASGAGSSSGPRGAVLGASAVAGSVPSGAGVAAGTAATALSVAPTTTG